MQILLQHATERKLVPAAAVTGIMQLVQGLLREPEELHWETFRSVTGVGGDDVKGGTEAGTRASAADFKAEQRTFLQNNLSPSAFRHLRRLIRAEPYAGHAICGLIAELQARAHRVRRACAAASVAESGGTTPLPTNNSTDGSLMVFFYSQLIGEMLLRRETHAACLALRYLVTRIAPEPKKSDAVDAVFRAFIAYIYETDHKRLEAKIRPLVTGGTAEKAGGGGKNEMEKRRRGQTSAFTESKAVASEPVPLTDISARHNIEAYTERVALRCRVYSALITCSEESHEFMLRRFCALEDTSFLRAEHGGARPMGAAAKEPPKCFTRFEENLSNVDRARLGPEFTHSDDASAQAERRRLRQECYSAFWAEYTRYCRIVGCHIFEMPLRWVMESLRDISPRPPRLSGHSQGSGRWPCCWPGILAGTTLHTSDSLCSVFGRVASSTRPWCRKAAAPVNTLVSLRVGEDHAVNSHGGDCSEPRITRWCNRLSFYAARGHHSIQPLTCETRKQGGAQRPGQPGPPCSKVRIHLVCAARLLPDPGCLPARFWACCAGDAMNGRNWEAKVLMI